MIDIIQELNRAERGMVIITHARPLLSSPAPPPSRVTRWVPSLYWMDVQCWVDGQDWPGATPSQPVPPRPCAASMRPPAPRLLSPVHPATPLYSPCHAAQLCLYTCCPPYALLNPHDTPARLPRPSQPSVSGALQECEYSRLQYPSSSATLARKRSG